MSGDFCKVVILQWSLAMPEGWMATCHTVFRDDQKLSAVNRCLNQRGFIVVTHDAIGRLLDQVDLYRPGCVILEDDSQGSGVRLMLHRLKQHTSPLSLVVLVVDPRDREIIALLTRGAVPIISWPCDLESLHMAVKYAWDRSVRCARLRNLMIDVKSRLSRLTKSETDLATELISGKPYKAICRKMEISERTLERRKKAIFRKTRVTTVAELSAVLASFGVLSEVVPDFPALAHALPSIEGMPGTSAS